MLNKWILLVASSIMIVYAGNCQYYCGSEYKETNIGDTVHTHSRNNTYQINVVFHILYENGADTLTTSRIWSQMDRLNADFNNQNANLAQVPSLFRSYIGNPQISFCLATLDPNGMPTTGVNRVETRVTNIGNATSVDGRPQIKYTSLGGQNAWDPEVYLNIWVGKRVLFLGESTFPDNEPMQEQGIIIDPEYIGKNDHPQFGLGRVLTHEIGHYLGLQHPWGNEGGCQDDDGIDDSPIQEDPYFGCVEHPQVSCGSADMIMNFMNTMDDACMSFFTQDQVDRMHRVLDTQRTELGMSKCGISVDEMALDRIKIINSLSTLELHFESEQIEDLDIQVFDLQGRLIYDENIGRRFVYTIDTKAFSDGVYILRMANMDSELAKLIYIHK